MANKTKNLAEAIRRKLATDPDLAAAVESEQFNVNVGAEIYRIRKEAGLSQRALADRIGSRQPVIARLEDADYDSHSLKMLLRIAEATGKRLVVQFVDKDSVPSETAKVITGATESEPAFADKAKEWNAKIISPKVPLAK